MKLYNSSWKVLRKNLLYLPIPVISDLSTLCAVFLILSFFRAAVENPLTDFLINIPNPEKAGDGSLLWVISIFIVMYFLIYFCFTILQAISWHYAYKFCNLKVKLLKRFFLFNIIWFILFIMGDAFHNFFLVLNRITGLTVMDETLLIVLYVLFAIILSYFILISYSSSLTFKKSLIMGIKKAKILILVYVIILITFIIINYTMVLGAMLHKTLNLLLGIVLFLPMLTWARIYLILALKEALRNH